jgi:hypothetical protein
MALRNCDGSPYRVSGSLAQFDPDNPEHLLFNMWDEEAIRIGGSPIMYYEVFIQSGTVDPLYKEDRGKIFSDSPIPLYGYYEPVPSKNLVNAFGIDSPDEMIFEFNYAAVLKAIGHPPKIGSRLFTPHLREHWVIVQRNMGEYKMWGNLRLQLLAQRFQESVTTGEGRVTQKPPEHPLNITIR